MTTVLILIAIFYLVWLLLPRISVLIRRYMMHKAEDYMRRSMGLPPREKRSWWSRFRPAAGKKRETSDPQQNTRRSKGSKRYHPRNSNPGPVIPRDYAEDVEYVEIKEFSSKESVTADGEGIKYKLQEQVSDVEWVEIKDNDNETKR